MDGPDKPASEPIQIDSYETSQRLMDWTKKNAGRLDQNKDGTIKEEEINRALKDPSFQGTDKAWLNALSQFQKGETPYQRQQVREAPVEVRGDAKGDAKGKGQDKRDGLPDIEILESCKDTLDRVFKRMDTNFNGKLTWAEVEKAYKDGSIKGRDAHSVIAFHRYFDDIAALNKDHVLKDRQIEKTDLAMLLAQTPDSSLVQAIASIGTGDRPSKREYRGGTDALQAMSKELRDVNDIIRINRPESKEAWNQIAKANGALHDLHKEYQRKGNSAAVPALIKRAAEETDKAWSYIPEDRILCGWWGEK